MFARIRNKLRGTMPDEYYPQVRFIEGREVYPREGESIQEWHERKWAELPRSTQRRAVNHLRDYVFTAADFHEFRKLWHEAGPDWASADFTPVETKKKIIEEYGCYIPTPFHFGAGMGIRNELRDVVKDDELPTGNWDDYYIPAIERAIGVRE